jgi:hypothetical protein
VSVFDENEGFRMLITIRNANSIQAQSEHVRRTSITHPQL